MSDLTLCALSSSYKDQTQTSQVTGHTQFGDRSLHRPLGMKRNREGEETTARTGSSRDGGSGRGYDVFLSFRGADTRLTIADSLYNSMARAGIHAFKDDQVLLFGENIRDDVKLKTELYRKALQKHESDSGMDLAKQWEEALREVAGIRGRNLKDHGFHELVNLTVEEISTLLWTRRTNVSDHLVGIKHRKDDIMKILDEGASDVRFIVIHGMGGIGKTTLADVVFKEITPQFQGYCCFLSDVRTHDILNLQKKLLSNILNVRCTNLSNIDEGADMIKTRFHDKKVLIVLDDIDKLSQIMRLAGEPNWFGGGSRIIITTRNIDFLVTEVEDDNVPTSHCGHVSFYEMLEMDHDDALRLFCERALGRAKPPPDYMDISGKLINTLGRLPLALDVMGSTLRGKCQNTWEDVLQKLKKVMNKDIKKKLMISYEALEYHQQQIYLDIACFFINQEKTIAIAYWDAIFGYPTEIEVKILTRMSLIKITYNDKLWMHDQLRDLGRDIVHLESCKVHLRGSRLWSPKDAFHVLQRKKGTESIVALNLGTPQPDATYRFKRKEFARLVNLRFLQLDHGNFEGDFKDIFLELRWLSWSNCPSEFQATSLGLENLAVLELSGINITEDWGGWYQIMVAKQLKVLKLMDCPSLGKTPEFSAISGLERLILRQCTGLRKIDESIGNLHHLDYLEIECEAIESLPQSIGSLKSLSKLTVQSKRLLVLPHSIGNLVKLKHMSLRCSKLRELPSSIGQLESLLELDIPFSKIRKLPHSIGNLERLEVLNIAGCKLEEVPNTIGSLKSLLELDLQESDIMRLPDSIGNLKKLKFLDLDRTDISELPKTIGTLKNLEWLHASECELLEGTIPSELGALSSLRILRLSCSHISRLPTTINQLTNLQELHLLCCDWIQQLPELPKSLTLLHFSGMLLTTIPNLSYLTNLVDLHIHGTLVQEPNMEWLVRLRALRHLTLVVEDMTLPPTDLSSLSQLQFLKITCVGPRSLIGLPSSLQYLTLRDVQSPIDWSLFSNLDNLSRLALNGYRLGEIRFDVLGKLRKFNELRMRRCPLLKTLTLMPCFKEIRHLALVKNPQLTEIRGLGELKSLQYLYISYCNSIKRLAETDLSNLQNLNSLKFQSCESLESVPDVPYRKSSCHLTIQECPRLRDFDGPYRFYRDR
ncbi:disease resistance protein RPV1-like isoform X2 [Syzygium oleosum]|uniref:disease resistance protein RPV1-like isoform X2 n=1 Tax=Syzygium oleosum TaxID=219896 RepID=UPI0024BA7092|nr:disease resistance protein RPV1-like isoform X2 [Syzygium oleosum]